MLRWAPFIAFTTAAFLATSSARATNNNAFQISDWAGRTYWDQKEKLLDRCSARLTNSDKITIIYSLDRHYRWALELSNPSWNFPKDATFDVTFGIGNRNYFRQRVVAVEAQLVRVQLSDSLNTFEAFRKTPRIELIAGGLTSQFDMSYVNPVLTALTHCVTRSIVNPKNRALIAAWLKSPVGAASAATTDPETQREARTLVTNLMSEVSISQAVGLRTGEVPAGIAGDAIWKMGDNLLTVSILQSNQAPQMSGVTDLIIGADAQKCRGDFFAGATLDAIERVGVARAYTNCQTQQAATSSYYFVVPRKRGGLYLLRTIAAGTEVTPAGEKSAKDIDGKVRASIMAALAKL